MSLKIDTLSYSAAKGVKRGLASLRPAPPIRPEKLLELAGGKHGSFWQRVRQGDPNDCWEWTGSLKGRRQPRVRRGDKNWLVSRWVWTCVHGPIPHGINVLHECDNPPCCNPYHYFLGTQAINMQDCVAKGRLNHWKGSQSVHAKLHEDDVREIRVMLGTIGVSMREIAEKFGVSRSTICSIKYGFKWTHVK